MVSILPLKDLTIEIIGILAIHPMHFLKRQILIATLYLPEDPLYN
jgi:hypothetical protein